MSLSEDDPISPAEKNQEPRESPQDSSSLSSKETEKKIMSQEPHHEPSRSSVSPMNTTNEEAFKSRHGSFSENPNYFESHNITGNLLNLCSEMARSLDFGVSQSYLDPKYITTSVSPMNTTNEEPLKSRHGLFLENRNMLNPFGNILDSVGSQRYLDSKKMMPNTGFANKNNGEQSQLNVEASSNSNGLFAEPMMPRLLHNHETQMAVDLRPGMEQQMINSSINDVDSSTWSTNSIRNSQHAYGEGYQSNFFLDSGGNIASMSSQRESSQNLMMPISGFVNRSSNNNKNNGQSYNSGGFSTAPEMPWLLHNPENQMGVSRMQQKISNESNSSIYGCVGMNAKNRDSGTSFTNYTRNSQQAYDNYSEMQVVGEIYDTNNSEVFGYQSNSFLGSGGNNASTSSQGDSGQNVMMPIPGGNNTSMNSDEEALTSLIDLFWENPYYHESDNITVNNGNLLINPSGGMLGGLLDPGNSFLGSGGNNASMTSQRDSGQNVMMTSQIPGFFNNSTNYNNNSVSNKTRNSQETYDNNSGMQASGEGYGSENSEPLGYQSNIPFGIESMMNAKREKDEITMIPTPGSANRSQWPIKKILTKSDVDSNGRLMLHNKKFIEQYFQKRLSEAGFRDLVSGNSGISVIVYDNDKHTTHDMRLTLQNKNYVLMGGWRKEFIKRRNLREGQEIGLFFDSSDSRLHFSVLNLGNAKVPARDKKPLVQ